jgi:hypothetical protein
MFENLDRVGLAEEILTLSQAMLVAYADERLEDLPDLQRNRETLIAALFADINPGELGDLRWVDIIRDVQSVNDQLVELISEKRDRLGHELNAFRHARKAESAYVSTAFQDGF